MNCLNSSLSKDRARAGAVARAGVGAQDITGVGVEVPLPSVGAALGSSHLLVGGGFQQGLRQAKDLAIALAG